MKSLFASIHKMLLPSCAHAELKDRSPHLLQSKNHHPTGHKYTHDLIIGVYSNCAHSTKQIYKKLVVKQEPTIKPLTGVSAIYGTLASSIKQQQQQQQHTTS